MTAIAHNGRRPSSPRGFIGPINQPSPSYLMQHGFNYRGLGVAYRNHFTRTFKEAGRTLLGVGVIETTSRASHHPTIARNVGYRYAFRPFLTITGGIATKNMIFDYTSDIAHGNFPGTNEPIVH